MLDQKTTTKPIAKPPTQTLEDRVQKQLEKNVEAPSIEDVLEKTKAALKLAQKAKQKKLQTWHCTECGGVGIQLYCDGHDHFGAAMDEDGVPVNPKSGSPLSGKELRDFKCVRKNGHVCGAH